MSAGVTMEEDDFVDSVLSLYGEKNWRDMVNKFCNLENSSKLLWVFPSEENLEFLRNVISKLNIEKVISVGCGCGLLEWIMIEALNIPVIGIEVDGAWWKCKYAPPSFIPLNYAKPDLHDDEKTQKIIADDKAAMLFCYFNNGPAFEDYMKYYKGNVLIIIGPGEGRNTLTNPEPFSPWLSETWSLITFQEVRNSKDFIAVYVKK